MTFYVNEKVPNTGETPLLILRFGTRVCYRSADKVLSSHQIYSRIVCFIIYYDHPYTYKTKKKSNET